MPSTQRLAVCAVPYAGSVRTLGSREFGSMSTINVSRYRKERGMSNCRVGTDHNLEEGQNEILPACVALVYRRVRFKDDEAEHLCMSV